LLLLGVATTGCGAVAGAGSTPQGTVGLHTLPGVLPPALTVTHPASPTVALGFVFVAQKGKGGEGGPVIADDQGRIRWYLPLDRPIEATDFRTQTYRGKPVLTWWEGRISKAGIGRGRDVVYDSSYRQIATVTAGNGLQGDLHEFQLTPRGTAFITAYSEVPYDLRSVGGPKNGYVYDSIAQEIDIATNRVVWEWHSLDHVPLTDSLEANREPARDATKERPLDYFHVNAVSDAPGGNILVSGRNTSALYLVARNGHIIWTLGGKHSDFGPPAAVRFRYQHDARLSAGGTLTLFDNGAIPKAEPYTRPLVLKVDERTRRVTVEKAFVHPEKLLSPFEGDIQPLPDGGASVGWGGIRRVTEFTPAGKVRFELKLPFGDTYRGFRQPWAGQPLDPPAVAVSGDTVYASWNGSTAVTGWEVLAGPDRDHLRAVARRPWAGLETAIRLAGGPPAIAVRALDATGRVLATSAVVTR